MTVRVVVSGLLAAMMVACSPTEGGGSSDGGEQAPEGGEQPSDGGEQAPDAGGGPVGTGNSISKNIDAEGGTISLDGVTLTVPAGAVAAPVEITITSTSDPAPAGYDAYSPVYRFEPTGTTFLKPVTVALPFTGDERLARLFWSRQGTTGYERVGGVASGGLVSAAVTHFSTGFIANGVDYTDPPDLSCTTTRLIEGRTGQPASSAVSVFFTVDDCFGRPVTGLDCENYPGSCDFVLREDTAQLSTEAQATVLPREGLYVFASLLLDVSSSTQGSMTELIDGAKAFVNELRVNKALDVPISIQLFAGEPTPTEWQPPTLDTDRLLQRLDEVASYQPSDPSSTNLYGGTISAIQRIDAARADFQQRNAGGAFTTGYVILFTDGADTAGLKTLQEAQAAVESSSDELLVIALQSADFDPQAHDALVALAGEPKVIVSQGATSLYGDFANLAARIAGQTERTYLLGYCSPKRSGSHSVALEIANSTTTPSLTFTFDASTFQPGCSKEVFETACDAKQCGGLGCGGCDDRAASCDASSLTCVSYCAQESKCGGETITNPRGYTQVCNDTAEVMLCSGQCTNVLTSETHCGTCGSPCGVDPVEVCLDGVCMCDPSGDAPCYVAHGQYKPRAVVVVDSNVYWASMDGTVKTAPLTGGSETTFATGPAVPLTSTTRLISDGVHLYWSSGGDNTLRKLPLGGSAPTTLATATTAVSSIALDATHLYWTTWGTSETVMRVAVTGGTPETLASEQPYPNAVAVNDGSVYWGTSGSGVGLGAVLKVPVTGGSPVTVASGQSAPRTIVFDSTSLYWTDRIAGTVMMAPLSGGAPTSLATGHSGASPMALSDGMLYWANNTLDSTGAVNSVSVSGGTVTPLATGETSPSAIAIAGSNVYWTTESGVRYRAK